MLYIFCWLTKEGAAFVKENIPEAEVDDNNFMTLELNNAHAYLDLLRGLYIYTPEEDYRDWHNLPIKFFKVIYQLKNN